MAIAVPKPRSRRRRIPPFLEIVRCVKSNLIAILALAVAVSNLVWTIYTRVPPPDVSGVISVLDREAKAAVTRDVALALSLYDDRATVRSAAPPSIWSGKDQIRERYQQLPEFLQLAHVGATVTFDQSGTYARVQAGTAGQIKDQQGNLIPISSVNGEEWTFRKIGGAWKIADFTYGAR